MEILLLLLLLVSAGALYLPELLKERALGSPIDTITDFRRGMTVLAISTHNMEPSHHQYYSAGTGEPEPYIRRNNFSHNYDYGTDRDIMPYPSNRARADMEARRNRIIALFLVLVIGTAILAIIPSLHWVLYLHLLLLVLMAAYIGVALLLPHHERRR
ncbi:MAG: hypothetical protein V1748_06390 [Actinomycetota bacterium]